MSVATARTHDSPSRRSPIPFRSSKSRRFPSIPFEPAEIQGNYSKHPNELFDHPTAPKLPPNQLAVYDVLLRESFGFHRNSCVIRLEYLCTLVVLSVNPVRAAIKQLKTLGLIEVGLTTPEGTLYKVRLPRELPPWKKEEASPVLQEVKPSCSDPEESASTSSFKAKSTLLLASGVFQEQPINDVRFSSDENQPLLIQNEEPVLPSPEEPSTIILQPGFSSSTPTALTPPTLSNHDPRDCQNQIVQQIIDPGTIAFVPAAKDRKKDNTLKTIVSVSVKDLTSTFEPSPLNGLRQITLDSFISSHGYERTLRSALSIIKSYKRSPEDIRNPEALLASVLAGRTSLIPLSNAEIGEWIYSQAYFAVADITKDLDCMWSRAQKEEAPKWLEWLEQNHITASFNELLNSFEICCPTVANQKTGLTTLFVLLLNFQEKPKKKSPPNLPY